MQTRDMKLKTQIGSNALIYKYHLPLIIRIDNFKMERG